MGQKILGMFLGVFTVVFLLWLVDTSYSSKEVEILVISICVSLATMVGFLLVLRMMIEQRCPKVFVGWMAGYGISSTLTIVWVNVIPFI